METRRCYRVDKHLDAQFVTVIPPPCKFTFIPALVNVPVNVGLTLGANVASVDVNEFAASPYMTSLIAIRLLLEVIELPLMLP